MSRGGWFAASSTMWFWTYLAMDESRVGAPAPNNNENNNNEKQRIPDDPPRQRTQGTNTPFGPPLTPMCCYQTKAIHPSILTQA